MTVTAPSALLLYVLVLSAATAWIVGIAAWPLIRRCQVRHRMELPGNLWFLLGMVPFLAGMTVAAAALISATLKGLSLIADHCRLHPGHPHLCWEHAQMPSSWLFWILLTGIGLLLLASALRVGYPLYSLERELGKSAESAGSFLLVESNIPAAFVAGILRPRIYLTTRAFRLLSLDERRIVLFHEQEHVRRRDPLKLALLRLAGFLFPGFHRIEKRWKEAAEIECDWACRECGEEPAEISSTIVKLARFAREASTAPTLAYALGGEPVLRQRVERLLSGIRPRTLQQARLTLVLVILALVSAGLSTSHHLLETILGTLRI